MHARNCRTGASIDEQAETARKEELLDALTEVARKFRSRAGESLTSIRKLDTPLAEALDPAYLRSETYLSGHEGKKAAQEFQKIVDHSGIILADPVGALAHLQLARALAIPGDRDGASAAYQEFLTMWKDADVPILKQRYRNTRSCGIRQFHSVSSAVST